jgi:hypothetical protein
LHLGGRIVLLFKMSLKGMVELVIWLESYYIVEYPQQGLFNFRLRLYQGRNKKRVSLTPHRPSPSLTKSIPQKLIKSPIRVSLLTPASRTT